MANISTGSIVSDIRGKVGNEIYSRNRGGAYVKAYVSPVQPDSSGQISARAVLAQAISDWQGLSDEQRQQWNTYASMIKVSRPSLRAGGQSGYNIYMRRRMTQLYVGDSGELLPIDPDFSCSVEASWHTLTTASMRRQYQCTPQSDANGVLFYYSPPVSSGVTSPNSVRYVYFPNQFDIALSGVNSNFLTTYLSIFGLGSINEGDRIFGKVQVMAQFNTRNGFLPLRRVYEHIGAATYYSAIIQAP